MHLGYRDPPGVSQGNRGIAQRSEHMPRKSLDLPDPHKLPLQGARQRLAPFALAASAAPLEGLGGVIRVQGLAPGQGFGGESPILLWPAAAFRADLSHAAPPVCLGKQPMFKRCKSVPGINLGKKNSGHCLNMGYLMVAAVLLFLVCRQLLDRIRIVAEKVRANVRQTKSKADYINRLPMMYKTVIIMQ